MKSTIIGVALLFACFFPILNAQIVPEQENCTQGDPEIGDIQPDVNLTVLPSTTIDPLSNIDVVCNAGPPSFPNSSVNTSNLPPENIKIYIGEFLVQECIMSTICVYNLTTFFPNLPRRISCTAANANDDCRFRDANILFTGETTVAPSTLTPTTAEVTPPVPTTEQVTPPAPTTATTTDGDEDTDSEEESESESESEDSDSD